MALLMAMSHGSLIRAIMRLFGKDKEIIWGRPNSSIIRTTSHDVERVGTK